MSALVLDAGTLVAVDRDDRSMIARLRVAQQRGLELRTNAMAVAQVWRDRHGRQANLARLLGAVDVRAIDHQMVARPVCCSAWRTLPTRSTPASSCWPSRVT